MAEQATPPAEGQQNVQLVIDEREMRTVFSNTTRLHTGVEEVIMDVGFNMINPNPQGGQPQLLLKVNDRVIMSFPTAKRLAASLGQLVKRYEQQFGEISLAQPGTRPQQQQPQQPQR